MYPVIHAAPLRRLPYDAYGAQPYPRRCWAAFKDFVKKYTTHLRLPALPVTLVGHLGCHLGRVLSLSHMPRVKAAQ